jgi:ribosomal protein L22
MSPDPEDLDTSDVTSDSAAELEATIPAGDPEAPVAPPVPAEPKPRRRRRKAAASEEAAAESAEDSTAESADDSTDEPSPSEPEPEPEADAPKPARRRRGGVAAEEAKPARPAKPAPSRRRSSRRDPSLPAPVVRAQAKYVRSSARKARLVCDHIRGKTVMEARAILAHTPRAVARDWSKLLESAIANAENNHELVGEDLYIKAVHADEGPTLKRFQPRARGRAERIRKRTTHLTILLTPKD